jgi:glutaredoxin
VGVEVPMLEGVSGFLDRFELVLVLGWGAIYFALSALFAYTLQAISDKTDAAPAWMCWVPFVQMHPFIRAAGTTWTALLSWIALLIAVTVLGAMASSNGSSGFAQFAGLLLILGSLIYFGRMMWRLAVRREVSGFLGLACLIPLFGLPFYFYIAFHDGPVRPSRVGLGVALVLAIIGAAGFRSDLSDARAMLAGSEALFGPGGPENPEEAQRLLESMQAAMASGASGELPASLGAAAGSGSQQGRDGASRGIASLGPDAAKRLYYQFTDERGSVRFVERLDQVPPAWRDRVGYVEMDGPPPMSPDDARRMRAVGGANVSAIALASASPRGARTSDVLLYYAEWCGYCRKTRAELDRRGVSFELRNIDNPATLDELVDKTGQRGIPVVDVNGKILIGYDPQGLDRLLGPAS